MEKKSAPNVYQTWDEVSNSNYVTTIKWGTDKDVSKTYGFDTYEELVAFQMGVEQSNGWLDYEEEGEI